ncbi:MAG: GNAT family N-acetyltransferase [Caldicoprobacterales bacterium]|nr:GNAT family N-acetyltransferase [Clostridiales bacterium]
MIRLAEVQDTSQIKDLWSYCFDDTPKFIDFFFQSCYQPENTLVVVEDGKIQSCLQLLPYRMMLREREVSVPYIVGVSTWPEFRGQGMVRQLLQFAHEILQERNIHLSILLPFQYDFYRKYGWEICYDFLRYRGVKYPSHLSLRYSTESKHPHRRFKKIDLNRDIEKLSVCYDKYMKRFHGYIIRNRKEWIKVIRDVELDQGVCYLYEEEKNPLGYILYTMQARNLVISELVYTTVQAKFALLELALSHTGQIDQIDRKAPSCDLDYLYMKDSRGKLEKETFVMGRIHNIIGALSGLPYLGECFIIQVEDCFYKNNNGRFLIDQKDGMTFVVKTNQKPHVIMDIRTLNQLLWGYLQPAAALEEGRNINLLDKKQISNLTQLFPKKHNYMTEIY